MAGKADVQTHLNHRRRTLTSFFGEWASERLTPDERTALLEGYFSGADLGEARRVGSGHSLYVVPGTIDARRPNILVVGRHDIGDLTAASARRAAEASLVGPGTASRVGPTIAFAEGLQAARSLTVEDPINVTFLSLGEGDSFGDVAPGLFTGNIDAVFLTDALTWSPHHPTLTTGARGQLSVQLTLDAGSSVSDYPMSGALRNPLTKMTQILSSIRNADGRIVLSGFYERAHAPDAGVRAALHADGHDPNDWAEHLGVSRPGGGLSALERSTLWPGFSVLAIETDTNDGRTAPASVTATVGLYLVPDQRHAEIERSLRDWFVAEAPADLNPSVKVLSSTRPFRSAPECLPVAAQARAAFRLYGRHPILVPAGGPAGAGEIAFAIGAPVGFAGITRPSASFGTQTEHLAWSHFEAGVEMAAETALQLRRA